MDEHDAPGWVIGALARYGSLYRVNTPDGPRPMHCSKDLLQATKTRKKHVKVQTELESQIEQIQAAIRQRTQIPKQSQEVEQADPHCMKEIEQCHAKFWSSCGVRNGHIKRVKARIWSKTQNCSMDSVRGMRVRNRRHVKTSKRNLRAGSSKFSRTSKQETKPKTQSDKKLRRLVLIACMKLKNATPSSPRFC